MKPRFVSASIFLAIVLTLSQGCSSQPVKQTASVPFSLQPRNFLQSSIPTRVAAASSQTLVLVSSEDETWTAFSLPSLARRRTGRLAGIRAIAIHPSESSFIALTDRGRVLLVSLIADQQAEIIAGSLPAGTLPAAAISQDASLAIARPPWGEARHYTLATAKSETVSLPGQDVRFLSIDTNGSIMVGPRTPSAALLRLTDGNMVSVPTSGPVISAAWDSKYTACGSLFWEFRVWPKNAPEKAVVRSIEHTPVAALAFGRAGERSFLFVGSGRVGGGRIRGYELPECKKELVVLAPECNEIIYLSVHQTSLLAVSVDGMVGIWTIIPGDTPASSTNTPASPNKP